VSVGICARNSIISPLLGDLGRSVGVVTAIRQSWLAARARVGRSDPVLRFVRMRQRFVRRSHHGLAEAVISADRARRFDTL